MSHHCTKATERIPMNGGAHGSKLSLSANPLHWIIQIIQPKSLIDAEGYYFEHSGVEKGLTGEEYR